MAAGPVSRLGSFEPPGDKTGLHLSPHLAPFTSTVGRSTIRVSRGTGVSRIREGGRGPAASPATRSPQPRPETAAPRPRGATVPAFSDAIHSGAANHPIVDLPTYCTRPHKNVGDITFWPITRQGIGFEVLAT